MASWQPPCHWDTRRSTRPRRRGHRMIARPSSTSVAVVVQRHDVDPVEVSERLKPTAPALGCEFRHGRRPRAAGVEGHQRIPVSRSRINSIAQKGSHPTDLIDRGVVRGDPAQARSDHVGAQCTGVLNDALVAQDVDGGDGRGTGERVAGVGEAHRGKAGRRTCRRSGRTVPRTFLLRARQAIGAACQPMLDGR